MANVFVSHRSDDTNQAELLAKEIQKAGHRVWLDLWDISIGDSIVQRMNEGLEGSSYVVLCYSSLGITSPWMSREWLSALAQQMNGVGVKILPVNLTGGTPPAILADIKYADLVKNWNQGVSRLLIAIK